MLYCCTINVRKLTWNEIGELVNVLDKFMNEQFLFDLNANEIIFHLCGDELDKNDLEERLKKFPDITWECDDD